MKTKRCARRDLEGAAGWQANEAGDIYHGWRKVKRHYLENTEGAVVIAMVCIPDYHGPLLRVYDYVERRFHNAAWKHYYFE